MCYLSVDRNQMTNLQESLKKEILLTNSRGSYCCTTVVGCNIRKYNGLLVVPVPALDDENHVLLSGLDETVIQHGAEFNLGVHKYQGDNYSPKGHKYIVKMEWERVPAITYRVGGVILKKEILFCKHEDRLLLRYTLVDCHSATTLRLRPFLAFRSVREFTHRNGSYNGIYQEIENGISTCMYEGYPKLFLQLSHKNQFCFHPDWYMNLDYPRERERGYSSSEDLYCPGYFELPIRKGESVIVSAGLNEINPKSLRRMVEREEAQEDEMSSFYNCLVRSAHQFHIEKDGEHYIIAGYPWFKCRARDFFIAMPGLTLSLGETNLYELYMKTSAKALSEYMSGKPLSVEVYEMNQPDVVLWAIACIQQYAKSEGYEACYSKYGQLVEQIIDYIMRGKHPNLYVHDNGLIYAKGKDKPITWMNSSVDGKPVIPRSGYIVEFNSLWYNDLCFWAELLQQNKRAPESEKYREMAIEVAASFKHVFLNKYGYLFDYVDETPNWDVRPNMLMAVALEYSPLNRAEQKQILDVCTRELVTPKGIRSLTPKSGAYTPFYAGPRRERDYAYHQGTAWPWLTGFYLEAYLKIYRRSGMSFIERQLIGMEEELFYHSLGSIPEFFDGNPPFHGRGAISFAINVSGIIKAIRLLDNGESA